MVLDLLLLAEVDAVVRQLAATGRMHAGRRFAGSTAHLGVSQRLPLRNSFIPSRRQRRQTGEC